MRAYALDLRRSARTEAWLQVSAYDNTSLENDKMAQHRRARRVAWLAAALSIGITAAIGLPAAMWPQAWLGLFTTEPSVIAAGSAYLFRVAPFYVFTGLGMALFFASQGAGRMSWPLGAGVLRLLIVVAVGGPWVTDMNGSMGGLFWIVALSQAAFGLISVVGVATSRSWGLSAVSPLRG